MKILFVCTGNTCRSPMAAALAEQASPGVTAASAGTHTYEGRPASVESIAAMSEIGIDLSHHRSRSVEVALAEQPDLIYALGTDHLSTIVAAHPDLADRVHVLKTDGTSVEDPIGQDLDVYRTTRDEIAEAVRERTSEWS